MRLISLFTLLFVLTGAKSWEGFELQNACHIFNMKGETIKTFPGNYCQFLDDGSYISATGTELSLFTKNREQKWKIKGNFHHQVNFSQSKNEILVLSTLPIKRGKKTLYEDHFLIVDLNGKIIKEIRSSELIKQLGSLKDFSPTQITHFNSFYDIPSQSVDGLPSYVKEGNYIINAMDIGLIFLASDFKTILHHEKFGLHQIHDAQVLSNGKLLYFNNVASPSMDNPFSAIEEFDLLTQRKTVLFESNPKQMFFSPFRGGVQELDKDTILFSHILAGTYIYDLKKKEIILNEFKTHLFQDTFYPAQQVKARNLKKFLGHWK